MALPLAFLTTPLAAQRAMPDSAAAATVLGTVYDSVGRRPLAGAVVQLVPVERRGVAFSATTDADGMFRIAGVPRDRYLIGFLHPGIDSLGLGAPTRTVDVRGDSALQVPLALPAGATIRAQLCGPGDPKDSSGVVLGFVRDADSGQPLGGSTVVAMWSELVLDKRAIRQEQRQLPGKTSPEGWFAICGLPTDATLAARAELGGRASGYIELEVPARGVLHRDFGIPADSAAVAVSDQGTTSGGAPPRRGTAQLTGTVRGRNGKPLAGAQVIAWGSGSSTLTSDQGTYALANLPAGTQTIEARLVGYVPRRVAVDLASAHTTSVSITLTDRVTALEAVQIFGKRSQRASDLTGFLERKQRGLGRFISADDIERQNAMQFTDILYTVPGVRVVPRGPFDQAIQMRGGCTPTVYIDRVRLINADNLNGMVSPNDIVGIEVYGTSTAPVQFYSTTGCGSIVIWTRSR
jgi:hypothetical protein